MKYVFKITILAGLLALLSGCATTSSTEVADSVWSEVAVTIATSRVIGDDADRAVSTYRVTGAAFEAIAGDPSTTVEFVVELAKSQIDWSGLDADERVLVELLINTAQAELEAQAAQLVGSESEVAHLNQVNLRRVLMWIQDYAFNYLDETGQLNLLSSEDVAFGISVETKKALWAVFWELLIFWVEWDD